MKPVLVIGAAGQDEILRLEQPFALDAKIRVHVHPCFGHFAVNVASHLVRVGEQVTVATALGDDPTGDALAAWLQTHAPASPTSLQRPGISTAPRVNGPTSTITHKKGYDINDTPTSANRRTNGRSSAG